MRKSTIVLVQESNRYKQIVWVCPFTESYLIHIKMKKISIYILLLQMIAPTVRTSTTMTVLLNRWNGNLTSSSLSRWTRGVKRKLRTSQAKGGCQSYNTKRSKYTKLILQLKDYWKFNVGNFPLSGFP